MAYFPSYEIVTGAFTRGRYFAADLRSVTEEGVEHVMRLFLHHATTRSTPDSQNRSDAMDPGDAAYMDHASRVADVICDEDLLGRMM